MEIFMETENNSSSDGKDGLEFSSGRCKKTEAVAWRSYVRNVYINRSQKLTAKHLP